MNRKIIPLLLGLFITTIVWSSEFCFTANTLPLESSVCGTGFTSVNFSNINPTSTNLNGCDPAPPPDFWIHVYIPIGSTGNFMIREREGSTITALAEVLYKNNCAPSNGACCDLAVSIGNCYSFSDAPNAIILENQPSGDYYIRVWDSLYATTGIFNVSAHELPADINEWVFCDESTGEGDGYVANQLIIEPGEDFDPIIFNADFAEIKSCDCADPPLLLYEASNYEAFLQGQITAKNATCVEGTSLNFILPPIREPFSAQCGTGYMCGPINKYKSINPSSTARIAIVDSGLNFDHEAFTNGIWQNMETNDGDNCVENDIHGYDFKNDTGQFMDTEGHGSWVAGTVIEDFPSDIQLEIMSVKFFDDDSGNLFDALCGMHYAVDEGASAIVTSWGFKTKTIPSALHEVMNKALQRDVLIFASAGNDSEDNDIGLNKYPANAAHKNLIVVAAYDDIAAQLASFSNYGQTNVDLAVIGHVVAPSITNNATSLTEVDSVVGTSIAAPRVARTALIMKAQFPNLDYDDIKDCILESVDEIPTLSGILVSEGILNHSNALLCAQARSMDKECSEKNLNIFAHLINDHIYQTQKSITSNSFIEFNTDITFNADVSIQLKPNFEIELGSTFTANILDCSRN